MPDPLLKLHFVSSRTEVALSAKERLAALYGNFPPEEADAVVALGGDGFMLETLHFMVEGKSEAFAAGVRLQKEAGQIAYGLPVYGMNCGSVGFLMNAYREDDLPAHIAAAQGTILHPLRMKATCKSGEIVEALAFNEVSLLRELRQAAKIRILIDGTVRMNELICDGVLVATPAGSTAYNSSAHGTIIPISAQLLALTPISTFRPRAWRGALLPASVEVVFEVLEAEKRPVAAVADSFEVRDILSVSVCEERSCGGKILFDPDKNMAERILIEQFSA